MLGDSTVQALQAPPIYLGIPVEHVEDSRWTLAGLYLAGTMMFASNATYDNDIMAGYTLILPDTLSNQFLDMPAFDRSIQNTSSLGYPSPCTSTWRDSTDHMLTELNKIAFVVSLKASSTQYRNTSSPPSPQVISMDQRSSDAVFQTDYRYLIASVVSSLFCWG